ncbi:MAG TPA: hypothetical protein VGN13_12220 [Solirubrobacteraceae bacterium]|jgi:hypothetical protein
MSQRIWFARDTGFTADPRIQMLGDEHGPGGPLVVEEMLALAKLRNNGGSLTASYATLARRAFVSPAKAKAIIAQAADGEEAIIELVKHSAKEFTARFPRWSRWQKKDPTGAARKAQQRERERDGDVT